MQSFRLHAFYAMNNELKIVWFSLMCTVYQLQQAHSQCHNSQYSLGLCVVRLASTQNTNPSWISQHLSI